jgi:predicted DNA binding CopG/RHH family protein
VASNLLLRRKKDQSTIIKDRIAPMLKIKAAKKRCAGACGNGTKRLTIDVSEPIHKALKIKAVTEGVTMAEIVRQLLMRQIVQTGS